MKGERDSVFTKDLSQYSVKEEIFIRIFIRSISAGEEVKMGKREEYLPLNDLKWRYLFLCAASTTVLWWTSATVKAIWRPSQSEDYKCTKTL